MKNIKKPYKIGRFFLSWLSWTSLNYTPSLSAAEISGFNNEEMNHRKEIYSIAYGHIAARALHIASYYKIFDCLKNKPLTSSEVAEELNFNESHLKALMTVLANHDLLVINEAGTFALNDKSKLLLSTNKNSIQPSIAKEYDNRRWSSLGRIDLALCEESDPFSILYGKNFYQYLDGDKKAADLFNNGMSNFSAKEDQEIPTLFDFGQFKNLCDVGGSNGSLIVQMISKHSALQGIVLDLKDAIEESEFLKNGNYNGRLQGIVGDFFKILPNADSFILKRVLHNWDFEHSKKILKNCVDSLNNPDTGRIFVVEKVMPTIPDGTLFIDTNLMGIALGSAPERTLEDFKALGNAADLELIDKIDAKTGVSLLVFKVKG